MRKLTLLMGGAILTSCTTAPPPPGAMGGEQPVAQMLAGMVAGAPMTCLPAIDASAPATITPHAILFSSNPGRVYVSSTSGSGCEGLTNDPNLKIESTSPGGSFCSGNIVRIVDRSSGAMVGSCSLAPFVPYTRP